MVFTLIPVLATRCTFRQCGKHGHTHAATLSQSSNGADIRIARDGLTDCVKPEANDIIVVPFKFQSSAPYL